MNWPDPNELAQLSDHQREQYASAVGSKSNVLLLTGLAGTGKTTLIGSLLRAATTGRRRLPPHAIAVAAPTGKAAVRITAALQQHGLHSISASTIHRLLGVEFSASGGFRFRHNAQNPLYAGLIVIDETSMLSVELAASLFSAIARGSLVLLAGDPGQLPSIQHGCLLRDLVTADLPNIHLREVHRNAGAIVKVCHAIRSGEPYRPGSRVNISNGENLVHIEASKPPAILAELQLIVTGLPKHIDPIRDVQVVTAMRKETSQLCAPRVNEMLAKVLNPGQPPIKGLPFRLRDRVICNSNTALQREDTGQHELCANGEVGFVSCLEPQRMLVELECPNRTVIVPRDQIFELFEFAYAATVHRMQGSQSKIVVYVVDPYPGARWVTSRELVYTALTRAQRLCVTVGSRSLIDRDCRRVVMPIRKTLLAERIAQLRGGINGC